MNKFLSQLRKLEATEADGWEKAKTNSCCPGDDWADRYNQAVKDDIKMVKDADGR